MVASHHKPAGHTIKASERPHHAGCFEKNLACLGVADKDFGLGMLGRSYWSNLSVGN